MEYGLQRKIVRRMILREAPSESERAFCGEKSGVSPLFLSVGIIIKLGRKAALLDSDLLAIREMDKKRAVTLHGSNCLCSTYCRLFFSIHKNDNVTKLYFKFMGFDLKFAFFKAYFILSFLSLSNYCGD